MKFAHNYRRSIAFALYVSLLCSIAAPAMAHPASPPTALTAASLAVGAQNGKQRATGAGPMRRQDADFGTNSGKFIPDRVTRRSTVGVKGFNKTRAQVGGTNGADIQEQVVDVTAFGTQVSDEIDPYWTASEQYIFFASNRDIAGSNTTGNYQIWRTPAVPSSGSTSIVKMTNEPGAIHRFPAVNTNENRIAFIKSTDGGNSFQLYVSSIPVGTTNGTDGATIPTTTPSLTLGQRVGGLTIDSVGRPAWLNSTQVVISARLSNGQSDIIIVDIQTGLITRLTNSAANEANVAASPDGKFIAFDSDATNYSAASPAASNGTNVDGSRNIFVMSNGGLDATQVTGGAGSGVADGVSSVQPAWSRSEPTPLFQTERRYFLAYASDRQPDTFTGSGFVRTSNGTKDIYYYPAIIVNATGAPNLQVEGTPPATPGASYAAIQQTAPIKLDTGDFDAANDANSYRFDDEYPTFPPLINAIRIGFQSDRKGSTLSGFTSPVPNTAENKHDIFIATLVDLTAPTLLRYDLSNARGETVHINMGDTFQPDTASSVRTRSQGLTPGSTAFFTVRADDQESGINSAYLQIKNPNSKYQSQAQGGDGREHKEYAYGLVEQDFRGAFVNYEPANGGFQQLPWEVANTPTTNVGTEYEAEVVSASDYRYYQHQFNRYFADASILLNFVGGTQANISAALNRAKGANAFINFPVDASGNIAINGPNGFHWGMYEAGLDDASAFTGTSFAPPKDDQGKDIWLKLARIDTISPELAAQYPGGKDGKGGTLYGAKWVVPSEASDWFIDVVLYDNAVNPFDPNGSKQNWIIYDNIWGFSTAAALSPQVADVLVVSDYMLGQKFLGTRLNRRETAGQQLQTNNLPNIVFGGESYLTDSDVKRFPDRQSAQPAPGATQIRQWEGGSFAPGGPFTSGAGSSIGSNGNGGTPNTLGVGSYIDIALQLDATTLAAEGTDGTDRFLPSTGRYSIWRILSRGQVPANVLNDYLPSKSVSPPDVRVGETATRTVTSVNRLVVWGSAFAQTTFSGAGTITDLQTQQDLSNFVRGGGKLFVAGQDIAFALAGNGQANDFLNTICGVGFSADNAAGAFQLTRNSATALANQIGADAFLNGTHAYSLGTATIRNYSAVGSEALELENLVDVVPEGDWRGSASGTASARAGSFFPRGFNDVVTATTASPVYGYSTGNGGLFVNPVTGGGTTVFASFGFESLTEGNYSYTPQGSMIPILAWRGRRSELMHNITCALRTTTVTGRVVDDNGAPVTDALVRASSSVAGLTTAALGVGVTDGGGNYQIVGLPPGLIAVEAYKQGYFTQVSTGNYGHGASRASVNLIVKRAGPGRLSGIQNTAAKPLQKTRTVNGQPRTVGGVFKTDDVTPIPNIPVIAYYATASTAGMQYTGFATVTSDGTQRDRAGNLVPAGQYIFPQDLPVGQYQVVVNPTRVIDPTTKQLVANTGQQTVTINGQDIRIPAANTTFKTDLPVDLTLNGVNAPGRDGEDIQGDNPDTPDNPATPVVENNEATLVTANATKTTDQPGDFVTIEENKVASIDFRLSSGEQRITGEVRQENTDGSAGAPVVGATVRATVRGSATVVGEGVTDANGAFTLTYNAGTPDTADDRATFPENIYTVSVAVANGYDLTAEPTGRSKRPSVDVSVGGDTNVAVQIIEPRDETQPLLKPGALIIEKLPPGSVSGLVTRVPGAIPTVGATVNLYVSDASGNRQDSDNNPANGITPIYTTKTVAVQTDGSYRFNYRFEQGTNYRTDGVNEPGIASGTYVADVALKGFSPNPVISSVFTVTSGTETRGINFTLESPKIYGGGIQLISIPLDYSATPAAADPRLIFGLTASGDNDGDGNPGTGLDKNLFSAFNVAEWTGDLPYNISPTIPLQRGEGYFVRFGGATSVTNADGVAAPGNEFTVTLIPGWNLIGHPFARIDNPYALPADLDLATGTRYTTPDGKESSYDEAVAAGLIKGVAYGYTGENSNSQYFQSTSLKPWLGYWFRNTSGVPLKMKYIRPAEGPTRSVKVGTAGKAITRAEAEKIRFRSIESKGNADWRLQIAARQGDLLDTDNSVGVSPKAKDGFDVRYDTEKPPVMTQAPQVYVAIEGKNETGRAANLADDIRDGSQASTGKRTWDFTVRPAEGKGDVTVFWPNVNRLPRGMEPMLVDVTTGKRVPMRSGASSFTFTPTGDEATGRAVHRFRIEVAKPSSVPLMLTGVRQTRIPGRAVGESGGYRFSFTVTREADVTAEVQTVTGKTVKLLSTRARASEASSITWDGRAANGTQLPAGAYILTLIAKDNNGSVTQQRFPLMNLR